MTQRAPHPPLLRQQLRPGPKHARRVRQEGLTLFKARELAVLIESRLRNLSRLIRKGQSSGMGVGGGCVRADVAAKGAVSRA